MAADREPRIRYRYTRSDTVREAGVPLPERIERALHAWSRTEGWTRGGPEAARLCSCNDDAFVPGREGVEPCPRCNGKARELWAAGCFKVNHYGCEACMPRRRSNNEGSRPDRERVPRGEQTYHRVDDDGGDIF